jgi:hypothetical protein
MGIVPLLFDKSGFQGLNRSEHLLVARYFIANVTPVLVNEIVGDLKKIHPNGKVPEDEVAKLADKFFGTGTSVSASYRKLMWASLDGADVPMTGQIIPENTKTFMEQDGTLSALVDAGPENWLILRLAEKVTTDKDRAFAEAWRSATASMSLTKLTVYLERNHVVLPRARAIEELSRVVDTQLDHVGLQDIWLRWLIGNVRNELLALRVQTRWQEEGTSLKAFAPYAHFCLRVLLFLYVANRSGLLPKWKSTHLVDAQYLYYLPCCGVFVSDDRLHRTLAPLLCRPDQRFIRASEFKSGLGRLSEYLDKLTGEERKQFQREPPTIDGNIVTAAWHHVVDAWDEIWAKKI